MWNTAIIIIKYFLIRNSKIVQIGLKSILGSEAGIHKIPFLTIPFFEAAVVEQFQVILDDKWHNVMLQALFK